MTTSSRPTLQEACVAQARVATPLGPMLLARTAEGLAGAWFDAQKHHPGPLGAAEAGRRRSGRPRRAARGRALLQRAAPVAVLRPPAGPGPWGGGRPPLGRARPHAPQPGGPDPMTFLAIDVGNTRLKWARYDSGRPGAR